MCVVAIREIEKGREPHFGPHRDGMDISLYFVVAWTRERDTEWRAKRCWTVKAAEKER